MNENLKKYLAEMLGTAVLVLTACGVAVFTGADVVATALAFGLAVVAMAYSIGNISGCHINPAVSLGALICKKINVKDFWCYVLFQIIGAIIGGAILFAIVKLSGIDPVGNMGADGYAAADTVANQVILSLIVEIALTFIFVFTVLGVISKEKFSALAGIVIGLTLTLVHLIGINLTGTSVNPARSIGVAIFGGQKAIEELWVFIVAPLVGAALAGIAAKCMFKSEVKDGDAQ
jgi:aquaporin Z